jgi:hypothetical protein
MNKSCIQAVSLAVALGASLAFAPSAQAQTNEQYVNLWDTSWQQYQALEAIPFAQSGYVSQSQDVAIVINAPLDQVYDIYANVYNALGIHPFMKSIVPIRHICSNDVPTFDFIAYDDIPLPDGTIFHGTTIAQQRFHSAEHYYDADSYDLPGVVTHQHIVFTAIDGQTTQVVEHMTFEAPPQYIALEVGGGVYAHTVVQQGLKAAIESGALQVTAADEAIEGDQGCQGNDNSQ